MQDPTYLLTAQTVSPFNNGVWALACHNVLCFARNAVFIRWVPDPLDHPVPFHFIQDLQNAILAKTLLVDVMERRRGGLTLGSCGGRWCRHVDNAVWRVLDVKKDAEIKMKKVILEEKKGIYRQENRAIGSDA